MTVRSFVMSTLLKYICFLRRKLDIAGGQSVQLELHAEYENSIDQKKLAERDI